jgi:hypothetical protein
MPVGYSTVWTGTQLITYSPDFQHKNGSIGAAYDPAKGWQKLPSSGYQMVRTESGTQVVWDGTEMLVFGFINAAFNPVTNVWRPLRSPPSAWPSVVVWTGRQVLTWGGGCCGGVTDEGGSYDVASNTWRSLPTPPIEAREVGGVWTGTELIIAGGKGDGLERLADAAAYNPTTNKWRTLPPMPAPRWAASITWTGSEVVVIGGYKDGSGSPCDDGYAYRPATNSWRHLPSMDSPRAWPMAVWTGHHLIVWGGVSDLVKGTVPAHGMVYDPVTNHWSALPNAPLRGRTNGFAAWTNIGMIIWGGNVVGGDTNPPDGAIYRP